MVKYPYSNDKENSQQGDKLLFQLGKSMAPDEAQFRSKLLAKLNQKSLRHGNHVDESHTGWFSFPMGRLAYASVVVIAVLCASVYWMNQTNEKPIANVIAHLGTTNISSNNSPVVKKGELVETKEDGQASLLLADHSIVRIDQLSSVKINKNRHITLNNGRLYADIAKSIHAESFIINSQNVEVIVLGTAFEVESNADNVSVKVAEGRVKVVWNGDETVLSAGEAINVSRQAETKPEKFALRYSPQWVEKLMQSEARNPIIQAMRKHFPSRSFNLNDKQ